MALVCAALLLFLTAAAPAAFGQPPGRKLIVTAAGVRLRERPETGAAEVGRLQLGAVVDELERSAERSKVGSSENFWHLVNAPGGTRGWVFGGLVAPFDPTRRDAAYLKLASDRLANPAANFADLSELVLFLDRATREVKSRPALAELELARLVALGRTLAAIPFEGLQQPPYKSWTEEREKEVVYSEPAGRWYVRADLLWDLQRKYRDLPVAERAAWEAARTPLPGECEGYLPCHLRYQTWTSGRYLRLYPRGPHAEEALADIAELLGQVAEDMRGKNPVFEVAPAARRELREALAELRAQVAAAASPKRAPLLAQLERIARHYR
jgi:hypothetical protein